MRLARLTLLLPGAIATLACASSTAPADPGDAMPPAIDPPAGADTVITRTIVPSATDARIVPTNGDHYVTLPARNGRSGRLLVYFPGTGARPDQYASFIRRAAELGDHALGLAYDNRLSVNFNICPGQPATCHERVRLEILTGAESGRSPPDVDVPNSAYARLAALLRHLHALHPSEGWDAFLDAGGAPRWERIAVAGHSQGGGHAAMTAKLHRVERAILFGATEPVAWTSEPFATPPARILAFAHTLELNYTAIARSWANIGIPGVPTSVDGRAAPFGSQRLTTTDLRCRGDASDRGLYHNCPIVDEYLPLAPDGRATVFQPVWDHLLTARLP